MKRFAIALAVFAAAATLVSVPAKAGQPYFSTYSAIVRDPCTCETLTINAESTMQVSVDGSKANVHINMHGTGTDSKGRTYTFNLQGNETWNFTYDANGDFSGEHTVVARQQLISRGGGPDYTFTFSFHITIDPDGNVTSERQEITDGCR